MDILASMTEAAFAPVLWLWNWGANHIAECGAQHGRSWRAAACIAAPQLLIDAAIGAVLLWVARGKGGEEAQRACKQ